MVCLTFKNLEKNYFLSLNSIIITARWIVIIVSFDCPLWWKLLKPKLIKCTFKVQTSTFKTDSSARSQKHVAVALLRASSSRRAGEYFNRHVPKTYECLITQALSLSKIFWVSFSIFKLLIFYGKIQYSLYFICYYFDHNFLINFWTFIFLIFRK